MASKHGQDLLTELRLVMDLATVKKQKSRMAGNNGLTAVPGDGDAEFVEKQQRRW